MVGRAARWARVKADALGEHLGLHLVDVVLDAVQHRAVGVDDLIEDAHQHRGRAVVQLFGVCLHAPTNPLEIVHQAANAHHDDEVITEQHGDLLRSPPPRWHPGSGPCATPSTTCPRCVPPWDAPVARARPMVRDEHRTLHAPGPARRPAGLPAPPTRTLGTDARHRRCRGRRRLARPSGGVANSAATDAACGRPPRWTPPRYTAINNHADGRSGHTPSLALAPGSQAFVAPAVLPIGHRLVERLPLRLAPCTR